MTTPRKRTIEEHFFLAVAQQQAFETLWLRLDTDPRDDDLLELLRPVGDRLDSRVGKLFHLVMQSSGPRLQIKPLPDGFSMEFGNGESFICGP